MRYANVGDYLHRHPTKRQYVGSPWELIDRNQDSDMAYLKLIPLIF
jgi:hypothetical protein